MTGLVADTAGVVRGRFTIPAGTPVGIKPVVFEGAGQSRAQASYVGTGESVVETRQLVTTLQDRRADPLAQTFTLERDTQVGGVDLRFTALGITPISIQIRETQVGMPTQVIIAEALLDPATLKTTGDTRVQWPAPVLLRGGVEYAIVALCNDSVSALATAELGRFDVARGQFVVSQPYQIGVLLSSSNASTWTPHQDRDLYFRLLACRFAPSVRRIELGTVDVIGATDLMVLASAELPSAACRIEYLLTLPDGTVVRAAAGQTVRLAAPVTGAIAMAAELTGSADASPLLVPGTQLVHGRCGSAGTYIARAMPAGAGSRVRVLVDARLPSGSGLRASLRGVGDTAWIEMPLIATRPADIGHEMTFELSGVDESAVHVQLELTGTHLARPQIANFRAMVL